MMAIPYLLPVIITTVFVVTAATPYLWLAMGLVGLVTLLRNKIGKFTVAEVVAEYDFFHHNPLMTNLKTLSGVFFVVFNAWILFFLSLHPLAGWALAIFVYSAVIINSNFAISLAHDLMHSARRQDRWLSTALLLQNGFFYLEADHVYIHHRHVGTAGDPATARAGEGLYTYLRRSVRERFRMVFFGGSTFPKQREKRIILGTKLRLIVCLCYLIGTAFFSWQAFICVLAQFVLVTLIYESVTYIQHYGLSRKLTGAGRMEELQLHHAWNCYYRTSAWMHYLMPVHSIHHLREEQLYEISEFAGCEMPRPFVMMLITAFFPSRWQRLMSNEIPHKTQKIAA